MLRNLRRLAPLTQRAMASAATQQMRVVNATSMRMGLVGVQQARGYYKDGVIMEREYGEGYMNDPVATAERIVRCIALHDNVNDPSNITLGASFEELGLNELDMCEIYIMLEKEFDFEISEDDCETFVTVNDLVEFVARNFYAK